MPYAPYTGSPSGLVVPSTQIVPVYAAGEDRSSSFSPLQIPGLVAWYDASRITGLADGDPVATWLDLSGNGRDASQATGSKRPTYKVGIVNARSIVRFDGIDDYLITASSVIPATKNATIVLVGIPRNTTSGKIWLEQTAGAPFSNPSIEQGAGPNILCEWDGTRSSTALASFSSGTPYIVVSVGDGTNVIGYVNGVAGTSASPIGNTSSGNLSLGARTTTGLNNAQIDIAEALIYSRTLATSELSRLNRALGSKYAIAVVA